MMNDEDVQVVVGRLFRLSWQYCCRYCVCRRVDLTASQSVSSNSTHTQRQSQCDSCLGISLQLFYCGSQHRNEHSVVVLFAFGPESVATFSAQSRSYYLHCCTFFVVDAHTILMMTVRCRLSHDWQHDYSWPTTNDDDCSLSWKLAKVKHQVSVWE